MQPIDRRAWKLQEELLSSCLLIFTKVGIYWKCQADFKPTIEVRKPGEANGSVFCGKTILAGGDSLIILDRKPS
jgi:hypothetical protein